MQQSVQKRTNTILTECHSRNSIRSFYGGRFNKINKWALLIIFCVLPQITASAAVLYESAENLDHFLTSEENGMGRQGWLVRDYRPDWNNATQFPAMPFTLSQAGSITGAELAFTSAFGHVFVQIRQDQNGLPSSQSLWAGSISGYAPEFQAIPFHSYTFTTFTGDPLLLEADTKYWLFVGCTADCYLAWWSNYSNPAPGAIESNTFYPYDLQWHLSEDHAALFRINGTFVNTEPQELPEHSGIPEPATFFLITTGLAIMSVCGIKRKKA
jgi:hypothetical protein